MVRKDSGAPRYYICVVEDITERRELERQLQHSQKMEAVGTLAGGIAHDFNNILTPILGYTQMLMEESRPGEKQYSSLQAIYNAAIRAQVAALDGDVADGLRVLYGGSVKPQNAVELFAQSDVDGGLIGGAALVADDFLAICRAAN